MATPEWYEALTQELLAQSPFRRSEYFKRFAAGTLTREPVWGHIGPWYGRCEDLDVREVVEVAQTVGRGLVEHYGVRPEWGAANYTVHEAIEKEESGETKATILRHLGTPDARRAAEAAMREMHARLERYADGLARRHLGS